MYLLVPGPPWFCWCQHFVCKKLAFFVQKSTLYSKQYCKSCVRDFLVQFSVFIRQKVTVTENITFADCVSGIRPLDWKNDNDVTIFRHDFSSNFLDILYLLSSLVTGPSFMSISSLVLELLQFSLIRDWSEIRKLDIPVWVLPTIWRLGRVMDTKFGTNVSIRMLLNAGKFQVYSFYRFWVIKGKPTGG